MKPTLWLSAFLLLGAPSRAAETGHFISDVKAAVGEARAGPMAYVAKKLGALDYGVNGARANPYTARMTQSLVKPAQAGARGAVIEALRRSSAQANAAADATISDYAEARTDWQRKRAVEASRNLLIDRGPYLSSAREKILRDIAGDARAAVLSRYNNRLDAAAKIEARRKIRKAVDDAAAYWQRGQAAPAGLVRYHPGGGPGKMRKPLGRSAKNGLKRSKRVWPPSHDFWGQVRPEQWGP